MELQIEASRVNVNVSDRQTDALTDEEWRQMYQWVAEIHEIVTGSVPSEATDIQ